jgi:hypothetical protein
MFRKLYLIVLISCFTVVLVRSQSVIKTSDLFRRIDNNSQTGKLNIIQDPAIDTLINRYILSYKNLEATNGYEGMEGFRIQIYNSSNRDAKVESGKALQDFLNKFPESKYPELKCYQQFALPGYYKIRVGDFRTKTEATRLYLLISKAFPDAYIVPDIIIFPDLNTK